MSEYKYTPTKPRVNRSRLSIWFALIGIVENDDEWLNKHANSHRWYQEGKGYLFIANKAKCLSKDTKGIKFTVHANHTSKL